MMLSQLPTSPDVAEAASADIYDPDYSQFLEAEKPESEDAEVPE